MVRPTIDDLLLIFSNFLIRYIYFAATSCDKSIDNYRMFVLENTHPDPFNGSFVFKGQITDSTNKWAIDGTVFKHPLGQLYYVWSGWEGNVNVRQIIYIARMSNPWTILDPRVEIARPVHSWEINHFPYINEGPQIIIYKGVISLVYSASGSWTNDYCLGLITASNTSDPMNATSWTKRSSPIFKSANGVIAPGHHTFIKSPDAKEDWIIYHSARFNGSGWTRQIRAQKFTWKSDSTPNLGSPVAPNTPIKIPSGDPIRTRYEAENATLVNGPYAMPDNTSSSSMKVGLIDYSNSIVIFTVAIPSAGYYGVSMRNGNVSPVNTAASHWVSINNGTFYEFRVVYSGWDNWGVSLFRTYFRQGENTITVKKGSQCAEIDSIDVYVSPS